MPYDASCSAEEFPVQEMDPVFESLSLLRRAALRKRICKSLRPKISASHAAASCITLHLHPLRVMCISPGASQKAPALGHTDHFEDTVLNQRTMSSSVFRHKQIFLQVFWLSYRTCVGPAVSCSVQRHPCSHSSGLVVYPSA